MSFRAPVRAFFGFWTITAGLALLEGGRAGAAGTDLPPITVNGHGWQVPFLKSRVVPRSGTRGPAPVQAFWAANGREWRVFWDDLLGTPRLVLPLEPVELVPAGALGPDPDRTLLTEMTEAFIDEHSDLFGVDSTELAEPFIYPVADSWVLLFQQTTPGGIPVRGASIRVIIDEKGELSWVKAFVMRECPDPEGVLFQEGAIHSSAVPPDSTVDRGRLEIGFPANDPARGMPIWSLDVIETDGASTEYIVDARTGGVIERRRIVKHFEETGQFLGRSPLRTDIFSSPQSGPALLSGLKEASIRGVDTQVIGITEDAGGFAVTTAQSTAALTFSLETGTFDPAAGFETLLKVMPLDGNLLFGPLDPAEDINQDGVPDITAAVTEGEAAVIIFNDNTDLADPGRIFRAWWLQAYHHSKSVLDFAVDNFERFDLSARIVPLAVTPASFTHGVQSWAPPSQRVPGFAEILTSTTFEVGRDARNQPIVEDVVPTILQHEVGHHIFFSVTNAHETDDERIEEGIADAIVGLTNGDCRVGFRSETAATTLGFCLGDTGDFRPDLRAKIGNSFFRLHTLLASRPSDPEPFVAGGLLLHWLARHRVQDSRQRILGDIEGILDEIVAINQGPAFDSGNNCPVRCNEQEIRAAFGDFLIAHFVRGDANLDQKVDLSDAVAILNFLFGGQGTFHDCRDAMDADDNAVLEITDAIRILNFLFLGSGALPAPFPECEQDPVLTDGLGCLEFTCPR